MDDREADELAGRVAAKLRDEHVIPAALPAQIGAWIRAGVNGRQMQWIHNIPLGGPESIGTRWFLCPDGSLHLELQDSFGGVFWRGTLTPVKEAPSG